MTVCLVPNPVFTVWTHNLCLLLLIILLLFYTRNTYKIKEMPRMITRALASSMVSTNVVKIEPVVVQEKEKGEEEENSVFVQEEKEKEEEEVEVEVEVETDHVVVEEQKEEEHHVVERDANTPTTSTTSTKRKFEGNRTYVTPSKKINLQTFRRLLADTFPSKYANKRADVTDNMARKFQGVNQYTYTAASSSSSSDSSDTDSIWSSTTYTADDEEDTDTVIDGEIDTNVNNTKTDSNESETISPSSTDESSSGLQSTEIDDEEDEEYDEDNEGDEGAFFSIADKHRTEDYEDDMNALNRIFKYDTCDSKQEEIFIGNRTVIRDENYNVLNAERRRLMANPMDSDNEEALAKINEQIFAIIKAVRHRNLMEYVHYIHNHSEVTSSNRGKTGNVELDYFKYKLSCDEQMMIIQNLREIEESMQAIVPQRVSLIKSDMLPYHKSVVLQKVTTLESMDSSDNEYSKLKKWVDGIMRVPFGVYKQLSVKMEDGVETTDAFLKNALAVLDDSVYGLRDAKLQTMQMLGQLIANPNSVGTAIGICGPPGTGKTSIVKDGISRILGREFAFIALGGATDSSFLEGHSYTYEGATWGKILSILMECKTMNPVIFFDELDKVSESSRGDEIIGVLTHLIDTTQNSLFHDKYFSDLSFDLSKCLFIFSYNDETRINPILKDRMYTIRTAGYSAQDKVSIAQDYLLPKICVQSRFNPGDIIFPNDSINYLATNPLYSQGETGVRNMKRCLETIFQKINLARLISPTNTMFRSDIDVVVEFPFTVTREVINKLIKPVGDSRLETWRSLYI